VLRVACLVVRRHARRQSVSGKADDKRAGQATQTSRELFVTGLTFTLHWPEIANLAIEGIGEQSVKIGLMVFLANERETIGRAL